MIKSVDVYFWFIFYKTEERGELHGLKKEASYSPPWTEEKELFPSRIEERKLLTPFTD